MPGQGFYILSEYRGTSYRRLGTILPLFTIHYSVPTPPRSEVFEVHDLSSDNAQETHFLVFPSS